MTKHRLIFEQFKYRCPVCQSWQSHENSSEEISGSSGVMHFKHHCSVCDCEFELDTCGSPIFDVGLRYHDYVESHATKEHEFNEFQASENNLVSPAYTQCFTVEPVEEQRPQIEDVWTRNSSSGYQWYFTEGENSNWQEVVSRVYRATCTPSTPSTYYDGY